jgi:hypothetical protein
MLLDCLFYVFLLDNDFDINQYDFFLHQVQWLNAYNIKIRKMVGDELLKDNSSRLGFEWMMDRTMPLFSDGRRNEVCILVTAALIVAIVTINSLTV